jgi:hypothetical protein
MEIMLLAVLDRFCMSISLGGSKWKVKDLGGFDVMISRRKQLKVQKLG